MRTPIVAIALLSLFACEPADPTLSDQYKHLLADKERVEAASAQKDASMETMLGSFNKINDNIREIRSRQVGLGNGELGGEGAADLEQRVMDDLAAIDDLMRQNKDLIAQLRKNARKDDLQIKALEGTIASLEAVIADKDTEISTLKEELSSANSSLATLIEMYREKSQLAENQEGALNAAYFALGSAKELRDNGIVSKTGGVAGIGGAKTMNMEGLNKSYFQEIDVTQTTSIPVVAKKAKLISSHPEGSYEFEGEVERLVIKDATAFWSVSKYLVIEVN